MKDLTVWWTWLSRLRADKDRLSTTFAEELADKVTFARHRDRDFFVRVYRTPLEVYAQRLRAIGFERKAAVLDAACGFGQWSLALAAINDRVDAFDLSVARVQAVKRISAVQGISNIRVCRSALDVLPYATESFDAIFCYGAIFYTDYRRSLAEFARVLKPGGRLYFTANDFGWYLYNLIDGHQPSRDFSPRLMAARTIFNTLRFAVAAHRPGDEIVLSPNAARRAIERVGLRTLGVGGDGELSMEGASRGRSFFHSHHYGIRAVYEVLCEKR
jgi:SAM-dependent methyltransferase